MNRQTSARRLQRGSLWKFFQASHNSQPLNRALKCTFSSGKENSSQNLRELRTTTLPLIVMCDNSAHKSTFAWCLKMVLKTSENCERPRLRKWCEVAVPWLSGIRISSDGIRRHRWCKKLFCRLKMPWASIGCLRSILISTSLVFVF